MKKLKFIFIIFFSALICITGCNSNENDDNTQAFVTSESSETTLETTTIDTSETTTETIATTEETTEEQAEQTTEVTTVATTQDFDNIITKEASVSQEKDIISDLEVPSAPVTQAVVEEKPKTPSPAVVRTPQHPGTDSHGENGVTIDVSNSSQGYICVKCDGNGKRLKLQISTSSMKYNYDLNNAGNYEVFPLQMGNTTYSARVLENVTGSSYRELYSYEFSASIQSSVLPFLYPNQYVNFNSSSETVKKSEEICAGCTSEMEKLKAIYNFMVSEISYDYDKASTVTSGYLPNVDNVLKSKKGICFDYSALMASMLRAQNIPTKLVVGSAGAYAQNHAWNEVYLSETGWITLKIQNTSTGWKLLDPTFGEKTGSESSYAAARFY